MLRKMRKPNAGLTAIRTAKPIGIIESYRTAEFMTGALGD